MGLFDSRYKKLEAFAGMKAEDRKPEHLAEVQTEMDRSNADLIAVPKTDTFKSLADVENHIDGLTKRAEKAEGELSAANATIAKLKGTTPETGKPDSPKVEKSPAPAAEETPEQKEQRLLNEQVAQQEHNKAADRFRDQ